jgi:hypothetical protein
VAFSADGRLAASVSGDDTGRVWEAEGGKEVRRWDRLRLFSSRTRNPCSPAFSADGKRRTANGHFGRRSCDVATGKLVRTF